MIKRSCGNGNKLTSAYLIYTLYGGEEYEEWYRKEATVEQDGLVKATLPEGTSHYIFNLVDEYQFMESHPQMEKKVKYKKGQYSVDALAVMPDMVKIEF